jgi:transcriptional regulator with XRE-family HTH domain
MLDNSLTDQLASRVKGWATNIGISQKELATLLDIDPGNLSGFLNGRNGLSAERVLKLMRLMNLNRRDLALRFGKPERTTSRIMSLQEQGTPVTQFSNSGYVLWDGGTTDPNDSTDITNTPKVNGETTGDSLLDCLRQVDLIHKQAREVIADYISKNPPKGKINREGPTEPMRHVPDNSDSSRSGSIPARYSK